MQVHLQKIELYGFHGLVDGEQITGGEFEVNLTVSYIPQKLPVYHIEQTVDYTALLTLVKEKMTKPAHLLETQATEIAGEIIAKFSLVTEVIVSISKLHPPIKNFEGSAGVTFTIKRD